MHGYVCNHPPFREGDFELRTKVFLAALAGKIFILSISRYLKYTGSAVVVEQAIEQRNIRQEVRAGWEGIGWAVAGWIQQSCGYTDDLAPALMEL